jgi:hypothetical protein
VNHSGEKVFVELVLNTFLDQKRACRVGQFSTGAAPQLASRTILARL